MPAAVSIGQRLLFSPEIEQLVVAEESKGVYTGDRLRTKDPAKYAAIVELSGQAYGQLRIAKLLGVHHRTVAAVQDLEPEQIDIARSKLVSGLRRAAWLQLERLLEHPETVPMNVSGLILSQLLDKAELLDGRATTRVEHTERIDIYEDWDSFVAKNLEPENVREIGLGEGNVSAIGLLTSDPAKAEEQAGEACSDALSAVQQASSLEAIPTATDSATDQQLEAEPESGGGGGLETTEGGRGLNSSTHSEIL